VSGPSVEACLARAVEGFTAAFADVHPSVVPALRPVEVRGASPPALLREVLGASLRLVAAGKLALGLAEPVLRRGRLSGWFDTVPLSAANGTLVMPSRVCWQRIGLDQVDGHWVGRIVASL
jgi:hypothetical protein